MNRTIKDATVKQFHYVATISCARTLADLTYITITRGFAYAALILDAWSHRVVGYAIGRSIDARRAATNALVNTWNPGGAHRRANSGQALRLVGGEGAKPGRSAG
jgi:hypothetical protein